MHAKYYCLETGHTCIIYTLKMDAKEHAWYALNGLQPFPVIESYSFSRTTTYQQIGQASPVAPHLKRAVNSLL